MEITATQISEFCLNKIENHWSVQVVCEGRKKEAAMPRSSLESNTDIAVSSIAVDWNA